MDRREFISKGLLSAGGVLIGKDITWADAMKEIRSGLPYAQDVDGYDLLVNGAGLNGYFIAMEAARQGMKVLVTDKRTSPGFDLAAKRTLWLSTEGLDSWDKELLDLFFPAGERAEAGRPGLEAPRHSRQGNELLIFAGSLKKGMMRSLLANKIDVLMMTDVCGILTDAEKKVSGAILAMKQGLFSVSCKCFVDATDQLLFTRGLLDIPYRFAEAGYVFELDGISDQAPRQLSMPDTGLIGDILTTHPGKKDKDHYFAEYHFKPKGQSLSEVEQEARILLMAVGKKIRQTDKSFAHARIRHAALECSVQVEHELNEKEIPFTNYHCIHSSLTPASCRIISQMLVRAKESVAQLSRALSMQHGPDALVFYDGKCAPFRKESAPLRETGFGTSLTPYPAQNLSLPVQSAKLAIAGAGTAGVMAALSACQRGVHPVVIEYFNDLGGTKTQAGVSGYYKGYQEHRLIQEQNADLKAFEEQYHTVTALSRSLFYLASLLPFGPLILRGAIICGAKVRGNKLDGILVSVDGRLLEIDPELSIDATGEGTLASFAGEEYRIGDSRMGITQNFSHWDIPFRPKIKNYNRDYDIINATEILETQRGLYLAHYESHFYDFYPMQAIRESRRIECERMLDMRDIAREEVPYDLIAQAKSDYDPHHFSNTELSRCGFILPHFDNGALINIPYRALIPKHLDGLLMSGKAIGLTYMALQFTRMSADVTVLGYVTGLAASDILERKCKAREYDVSKLQQYLFSRDYLPKVTKPEKITAPETVIAGLPDDDRYLWLLCCAFDREEVLPYLTDAYKEKVSLPLAKALAWFGSPLGEPCLTEELTVRYRKELLEGHPSDYFEVYDGTINYWQVNSIIALLGLSGKGTARAQVRRILDETHAGGDIVVAQDPYNADRIDLRLIPYYNRIINLVFYIERNPDPSFIPGLESLMDDPFITGHLTRDYNKARHNLYPSHLEILISAAAGRCTSRLGLERLADYLDDLHSDFRRFAHQELVAILKADEGYDKSAWQLRIRQGSLSPCPLVKQIEF